MKKHGSTLISNSLGLLAPTYIPKSKKLLHLVFVRAVLIPKLVHARLEVTHHRARRATASVKLAVHWYHSVVEIWRGFNPNNAF